MQPFQSSMPSAFQSYTPKFLRVYGAICINSVGYVLLVRGRKSKKWSFPKGHCKSYESDIQCAKRELFEETGLVAPETYISSHKLRGGEYFLFPIETEFIPSVQYNWEIQEVAWHPLEDLPTLDTNIDVSIFRTLMKSMKESSTPIRFIDSIEARRRVYSIKQNIQKSMQTN